MMRKRAVHRGTGEEALFSGFEMYLRLTAIIAGVILCLIAAGQAWGNPVDVTPLFGQNMYYVGTVDADGDNLNDLTGQPGFMGYSTLGFSVTGLESFGFFYNFLTRDYPPFDQPGFIIDVTDGGGAPLEQFSYNAGDIDSGIQPLDSTGWWTFTLSGLDPLQTYNLLISAGNTGDGLKQSFAFIDWYYPNDSTFPTYFMDPVTAGQTGFTGYFHSENLVPAPAAVWLLGSGLIGVIGVRRKFRR